MLKVLIKFGMNERKHVENHYTIAKDQSMLMYTFRKSLYSF